MNSFQLPDKYNANIILIFALGHASSVESFIKTMKNRMKYMNLKLKHSVNWSKIVSPVLNTYNNSPHSPTKISPNNAKKDNEI
jgi:hypothetical protein